MECILTIEEIRKVLGLNWREPLRGLEIFLSYKNELR
jgi:hypothetical protein